MTSLPRDSEITHILSNGKVKHVVYKTFEILNAPIAPLFEGFELFNTEKKPYVAYDRDAIITRGKKYIYTYIKYLD